MILCPRVQEGTRLHYRQYQLCFSQLLRKMEKLVFQTYSQAACLVGYPPNSISGNHGSGEASELPTRFQPRVQHALRRLAFSVHVRPKTKWILVARPFCWRIILLYVAFKREAN